MKLIYRRTLFVFFTLLFFIIAPLIIFYGSGYRYRFDKGRVEQVGQLYITTTPKGANVFLDGKPFVNEFDKLFNKKIEQTPTRLQNLLPGEYRLDLKKDGYWDWSRVITVAAQKTAFASDLLLLKKTEPELLVDKEGVVDFYLQGDRTLYFATTHDLASSVVTTKQERSLWKTDQAIMAFEFSDSANAFIVQTDKEWLVVDGAGVSISLNSLGVTTAKAAWSKGGQLFVLASDGKLSLADWKTKRLTLLRADVLDFSANDGVYLTTRGSDGLEVWRRDLGVLGSQERIAVLSATNNARFIAKNENFLALKTDSGVTILDVSGGSRTLAHAQGAEHISWVDETEAIVYGDFEVQRYAFLNNHYDQELITRQGEVISNVISGKDIPYIFFFRNNTEFVALERGLAEVANSYTLLNGKDFKTLVMSPNSKELFFSGTVGEKQGIYRLQIID